MGHSKKVGYPKTWRHSFGERAQIVLVGAGFAAVFLMLSQVFENAFPNAWHDRELRELPVVPHALAIPLIFGARFLLLPAGLIVAIVAAWHGLVGKPTRLTLWILRQCDRGPSQDGRSLLEPPDWSGRVVPGWLAWSIVVGMLAVFASYAAVQRVLNR